jgi:hypothetical protein
VPWAVFSLQTEKYAFFVDFISKGFRSEGSPSSGGKVHRTRVNFLQHKTQTHKNKRTKNKTHKKTRVHIVHYTYTMLQCTQVIQVAQKF